MESTAKTANFRDYEKGETITRVRENYRKMRTNQTVDYVQRMRSKYLSFEKPMHIWDAMEKLNVFVDLSDPDMNLPNLHHLIQTAEGMRADNRPDWMQLVGLIHDLGKCMFLWGEDEDGTSMTEQWGLVGDIFLVGCQFPETLVYSEFNNANPDMQDSRYNTELGMYTKGYGLDNALKAWGHDEYFFQVLSNHKENSIPKEGMTMIRYHSFYPWHTGGSYMSIMAEEEKPYLDWVKDFNQYDLYTKRPETYTLDDIKGYYLPIIEKYLGKGPVYW
jgi:inositol oxygenase